jgi:restriction system protein
LDRLSLRPERNVIPIHYTPSQANYIRKMLRLGNMQTTSRPGYEYLSAYTLGKVIQDLTVEFCNKYINCKSRTHDQMVQAARSNSQNVAEGYSNPSLKGYIKLAGIAYGSNEELTKDYQDFLRQRNLPIWNKNHPKVRKFREFRAVWVSPTSLNTPSLPNNPTEAANMLLTFCNLDGFLLKKLVASLLEKHEKEGGLTEELYRKRIEYRQSHKI